MSAACKRTVLVVEDDGDVRDSLSEVLTDSDYETVCAENGQQALAALHAGREHPCVILLDIMMPIMDGHEFRGIQANDPDLSTIPVVVLTAHADIKEAATAMGAAAYLQKPVNLAELLSVVDRFCAPDA